MTRHQFRLHGYRWALLSLAFAASTPIEHPSTRVRVLNFAGCAVIYLLGCFLNPRSDAE